MRTLAVLALVGSLAILLGAGEPMAQRPSAADANPGQTARSVPLLKGTGISRLGNPWEAAPGSAIERFSDLRTPWNCFGGVYQSVTMNRVRPTSRCNIWQPADLGVMSSAAQPWARGGGIFETATRYGPGFRAVVTPEMTAPWGGKQAWLVDVDHLTPHDSFLGTVEKWSGKFMFPSSGNPNGFPRHWHAGLLWEWHTESMSGNHFAIDGWSFAQPRLRFGVVKPDGSYHFFFSRKNIQFDHWYSWRIKIKWSYGSDGFLEAAINDELRVNHTGPTLKQGERPYLQFGYYATPQLRNEVWFAEIRRS